MTDRYGRRTKAPPRGRPVLPVGLRRRLGVIAIGVFATFLPCMPFHVRADEVAGADPALIRGKSALEDGLFALAEAQFRAYLATSPEDDPLRRDSAVLLLQALHAQGKYSDMLDFQDKWAFPPETGAFLFWRATALRALGRQTEVLDIVASFGGAGADAQHVHALVRLRAWCLLDLGRAPEALDVFAGLDRDYADAPDAPRNLLDWGEALLALGRYDEAEKVLGRLAATPADPETDGKARYGLAVALVHEEKWGAAAEVLGTLVSGTNAVPDRQVDALRLWATVHGAEGRMAEAVDALRTALAQARTASAIRDIKLELGGLLIENGDLDEGVALLKTFVAAAPEDPRAGRTLLSLGHALINHGRCQDAVEEFQHHLETFTNAQERAEAYNGKGWALLELGRNAEAAAAFERACDLFSDPEQRQRSSFKVGDAYFANGQYRLAAEAYGRLLGEFPKSLWGPQARFQSAESLARAGDVVQAQLAFRELAETNAELPLAEEALLRVAELDEAQGKWLEALESYSRTMDKYPGGVLFSEALRRRGLALYHLLRFGEALQDFGRIVTDFGDSDAAEQAFWLRAMCHYWTGNDAEAKRICREFIERFPVSEYAPEVLFWIGKIDFNEGDYAAAEASFVDFAARFPRHSLSDDALLWAGRAAAKRKEYLAAIEFLSRLVKDYPDSDRLPKARFAQADALSELARFSDAILIFDEIINKYPDSGLTALAWCRKGDCQFTLGAEDPKRYEESLESYRVVGNAPDANLELVMQALYKTGRCWEKMGLTDKAFEQYYFSVIIRYFEDREKGLWHSEVSKLWFTRAAFNAADIMETREDWRTVVNIMQRVVDAGVSAADEARERIAKIRAEHWLPFY